MPSFFQGSHELLTGIGIPILVVLFEWPRFHLSSMGCRLSVLLEEYIFLSLGDDRFAEVLVHLVVFNPRRYVQWCFSKTQSSLLSGNSNEIYAPTIYRTREPSDV